MSDKVDRLVKEEEALADKLKRLREERLREEKKLESQRAEVVGRLVLKRVSEGVLEASWLRSLLSEGLARKADRTLFDLDHEHEDETVLGAELPDDVENDVAVRADDDAFNRSTETEDEHLSTLAER